MMTSSKFITVEGIEGVGKSTSMAFIQNYLQQAGKSVVMTREPGGTPLAENLRHVLLDHGSETVLPITELLLMFAGRAQHIAEVIRPALAAKNWVLSDRFTDATYAYQGAGRGMSLEYIATLEAWIQKDLQPDLVLLLDAPVEIALRRARRRAVLDRFEKEEEQFFRKVRDGYLMRAKQNPKRYRIIHAGLPRLQVKKQIQVALDELLSCKEKL